MGCMRQHPILDLASNAKQPGLMVNRDCLSVQLALLMKQLRITLPVMAAQRCQQTVPGAGFLSQFKASRVLTTMVIDEHS